MGRPATCINSKDKWSQTVSQTFLLKTKRLISNKPHTTECINFGSAACDTYKQNTTEMNPCLEQASAIYQLQLQESMPL